MLRSATCRSRSSVASSLISSPCRIEPTMIDRIVATILKTMTATMAHSSFAASAAMSSVALAPASRTSQMPTSTAPSSCTAATHSLYVIAIVSVIVPETSGRGPTMSSNSYTENELSVFTTGQTTPGALSSR